MGQITLGQAKRLLEMLPPEAVATYGFTSAHSYRGYYNQVAFEPVCGVSVRQMLSEVNKALSETFTGYKGGDFTYNEYTPCWLAEYGRSSDEPLNHVLGRIVVECINHD